MEEEAAFDLSHVSLHEISLTPASPPLLFHLPRRSFDSTVQRTRPARALDSALAFRTFLSHTRNFYLFLPRPSLLPPTHAHSLSLTATTASSLVTPAPHPRSLLPLSALLCLPYLIHPSPFSL